jgi:hypothetical protein
MSRGQRCGFRLSAMVTALAAVSVLVTFPAASQEPGLGTGTRARAQEPHVTVTAGLGNALGGLGIGLEHSWLQGRLSGAVGLGYWPEVSLCPRGTAATAAAVRGFVGRHRHRAFLETSVSLLRITCRVGTGELDRHYGPGLSLGYRFLSSAGFTFTSAVGLGMVSADGGETELLALLGIGYTWRR